MGLVVGIWVEAGVERGTAGGERCRWVGVRSGGEMHVGMDAWIRCVLYRTCLCIGGGCHGICSYSLGNITS